MGYVLVLLKMVSFIRVDHSWVPVGFIGLVLMYFIVYIWFGLVSFYRLCFYLFWFSWFGIYWVLHAFLWFGLGGLVLVG